MLKTVFLAILTLATLFGTAYGDERIDAMMRPFVSIEGASGSTIKSWRANDGENWCYILTAAHVVDGKDKARIKGEFFKFNKAGRIMASKTTVGYLEEANREVDYAIVSFKTDWLWPTVRLASVNTLEKLSVFERLYSVGRPNHEPIWVGEGILSSLSTRKPMRISHSAGLYYGGSGGPLFNDRFEQVGVNVSISVDYKHRPVAGVAYSVPLDIIYTDLGAAKTQRYFSHNSRGINVHYGPRPEGREVRHHSTAD